MIGCTNEILSDSVYRNHIYLFEQLLPAELDADELVLDVGVLADGGVLADCDAVADGWVILILSSFISITCSISITF